MNKPQLYLRWPRPLFYGNIFLFLAGVLFACQPEPVVPEPDQSAVLVQDHRSDKKLPASISFNQTALYPEAAEYDEKYNRFLVTSLRFGTIGQVSPAGNYRPFITDDRLISTIGLEIDKARQRVLVAVSDPGASVKSTSATTNQLAALGIYHLKTGAPLYFVDLSALRPGGRHFANDIALDPQGNAYVTDSFSPIIYKVDRQGNATVFFEDPAFATTPGQFGFNGIVYHPSGYLLVAFSRDNQLIRIPVRNPANYQVVQLNAPLQNPDGLLLSQDGKQLIVVNNAGGQPTARVLSFRSEDKWRTGKLAESFITGAVFPTSATADKKEVYVLYAYLNRLFTGANPPQTTFTIQRVPFTRNRPFSQ